MTLKRFLDFIAPITKCCIVNIDVANGGMEDVIVHGEYHCIPYLSISDYMDWSVLEVSAVDDTVQISISNCSLPEEVKA